MTPNGQDRQRELHDERKGSSNRWRRGEAHPHDEKKGMLCVCVVKGGGFARAPRLRGVGVGCWGCRWNVQEREKQKETQVNQGGRRGEKETRGGLGVE